MAQKSKNWYEILKVSPLASPSAIKKSYQNLARLYHPDKNINNPSTEELFKEVSQAYQILSDTFKRKEFDRQLKKEKEVAQLKKLKNVQPMYESFHTYPPETMPPPFPTEESFAKVNQTSSLANGGAIKKKGFSLKDLKHRWKNFNTGSTTPIYTPFEISLEEAILGAKKKLNLNIRQKTQVQKKTFSVTIPPGAQEGQNIKIDKNPDLYVSLVYKEHPLFSLDGFNIKMTLPIPFTKAILGGKVRIPTPRGEVSVDLPAGTHGGHIIQLKGQGFPHLHSKERGSMLVTILIDIPFNFSEQEKEGIKQIQSRNVICPKVAEFDIKANLLFKKRKIV